MADGVPTGAVENQNEVCIGRAGGSEFVEEDLHGGGVDRRQHQCDVLAGGWPNCGEDVGPEVAKLLKAWRARAAPPPAMADAALGFLKLAKVASFLDSTWSGVALAKPLISSQNSRRSGRVDSAWIPR